VETKLYLSLFPKEEEEDGAVATTLDFFSKPEINTRRM
jgi:hypothetical protein